MRLYGYWRSTAAYRVRIALNLKQIPCELISVNLLRDGGEQRKDWYLTKNPTALVPTLALSKDIFIRQSLAIIDYLEQTHPTPRLIPEDSLIRAKVIACASDIGMEIHPINNLRVVSHLKMHYEFSEDMAVAWMHHWMHTTFVALEQAIDTASNYCFGNEPTLADVFLVPQVFNAQRWGLDLSPYPTLVKVSEFANQQSAFMQAHPNNQSDALNT